MKTETKVAHTPGPWNIGFVNPRTVVDEKGREIVEISRDFTHHKGTIVADAYARLLAAAPEMLKACEAVQEACQGGDWEQSIALCKAAIRKAKGEL